MNLITVTLMPRIIYTTWILINTLTRDPFNLGISAPKKVFRQTILLSFQTYYFSVLPEKFSYTDQKKRRMSGVRGWCKEASHANKLRFCSNSWIRNLDPKQANKQTKNISALTAPFNFKPGKYFSRNMVTKLYYLEIIRMEDALKGLFFKSVRNIILGLISGSSGQRFLPVVLKGWDIYPIQWDRLK